MRALRKLTRLEELARRIVGAVDETFEAVKNDRHAGVPLIHKVETLQLPMRLVSDAEYAEVKAAIAAEKPTQMRNEWQKRVLERYESQKTDPLDKPEGRAGARGSDRQVHSTACGRSTCLRPVKT